MKELLAEYVELCKDPAIQSQCGDWKMGDMYYDIRTKTIDTICQHCDIDSNGVPRASLDGCIWLPRFSDLLVMGLRRTESNAARLTPITMKTLIELAKITIKGVK